MASFRHPVAAVAAAAPWASAPLSRTPRTDPRRCLWGRGGAQACRNTQRTPRGRGGAKGCFLYTNPPPRPAAAVRRRGFARYHRTSPPVGSEGATVNETSPALALAPTSGTLRCEKVNVTRVPCFFAPALYVRGVALAGPSRAVLRWFPDRVYAVLIPAYAGACLVALVAAFLGQGPGPTLPPFGPQHPSSKCCVEHEHHLKVFRQLGAKRLMLSSEGSWRRARCSGTCCSNTSPALKPRARAREE